MSNENNSKQETIKVYQRQDEAAIYFNSLNEFMEYYEINKEDIDKEPTRGLNRKYKIKGFKITRKKKKMEAIKINHNNTIDDLVEMIMLIDEKINSIQNKLNSISN
jgi:hypothetical protein